MNCVMTNRERLIATNLKTILTAGIIIIAVSGTAPQIVAGGKSTATASPFAGTYCGYWNSHNSGSMTISDSGNVSGYFSFVLPTFNESYSLSGQVSGAGVMRLKVVHTITVRDRGVRTSRQRFSVTINVALHESGNLVATSGTHSCCHPASKSKRNKETYRETHCHAARGPDSDHCWINKHCFYRHCHGGHRPSHTPPRLHPNEHVSSVACGFVPSGACSGHQLGHGRESWKCRRHVQRNVWPGMGQRQLRVPDWQIRSDQYAIRRVSQCQSNVGRFA